ncbi:MAG: MBL fold metallo-hydrolase [Bacteroidales bacterium]|nr:MBL fold metallo-hydrolase [Bacteroidales bacterium]
MPDSPKTNAEGLKVANMVQSGRDQSEAIERGPGIYENQGIGNSYLITTPAGDVLVNAGALRDARRGKALFAKVSTQPIRYIILTQSHANQFGGLEVFSTADNQVIAHRNYPEDRRYTEALSQHYRRGSRRIFSSMTGSTDDIMPTREVSPDILIDEYHTFELGGRRFEIIWTPGGETRSAVIVWLPTEKIAIVGNLFGPLFGNHPNLNTMRGDKPRSALQFIDSVKKVRDLRPEQILTGHEDIRGAAHIQTELTRIIDGVQWVHDKTVDGMNAGVDLRTLMRDIKTPPELTLTEEYGKVAWNVRAIWHEYTGWFDPSRGTTELYAVPPSSVAPAIAELAGGVDRIATKARAFIVSGNPLQALHLLDIALAAEPGSPVAKQVKTDALTLLLEQTGGHNLWEKMWISAEIRDNQT